MQERLSLARTVTSRVRDLLYPPRCVSCTKLGASLCVACTAAFGSRRLISKGRCKNCFAAWDDPGLNCLRCVSWGFDLDSCRSAFEMEGAARMFVLRLKYRGERDVAAAMSPWLTPLWENRFDSAVAVPLHWKRRNKRGFNQAELLLGPLGWPSLPGTLERIRETGQQVGRHEQERWRGLAGAFRYTGPDLTGMHIAVVDDVVTTGATVVECARALRDGGARSVTALSFARASYPQPPEPSQFAE